MTTGCEDTQGSIPSPPDTSMITLEQGWSQQTRDTMHYLGFGSKMIPYDWFLHLEQAESSALIRNDAFMTGLGFIPSKSTPQNPDALPVGFSKAIDEHGTAWVGLTCTACHTSSFSYQNQEVIIDGGAAMIDFPTFESNVINALEAVVKQPEKLKSFTAKVMGGPSDGKAQEKTLKSVQERLSFLKKRQKMNHSDTPYGHGRLDAFGQIFNTVAVQLLGIPENARPADAPVSYPFLWNAPHLDLVQWNGSAPNTAPGPLIQNVTTALAVFGSADVKNHSGIAGYPSSVDFHALGTLQEKFYELKPPEWPTGILGKLDDSKVSQGEKLYQENCQSCHRLSQRDAKDQQLKVTLVPLTEIGTDPRMAENFINATAKTGAFEGRKQLIFVGPTFGTNASTIDLVINTAIGASLRHPIDSAVDSIKDYHKVFSANANPKPDYYKARPLSGIWATAPYLHNGSVPTLYDLLLPPAQRPTSFHVGNRELDINKVGFKTSPSENSSLFDTTLAGNHNHGHIYGTDLTEPQRYALIEYLKSI
ncbi:di-heme-cytochrome C peroxidase [Hahella ganghwensis]|uniref:di-heme-cytochrome C peroxidase n=1 Tax=Hahella ganghwensis TaxID=286420 RepID=UPI0012FA068D|nr:di-heme-cytochrome C peroxidase [Hahella ganghwensis]